MPPSAPECTRILGMLAKRIASPLAPDERVSFEARVDSTTDGYELRGSYFRTDRHGDVRRPSYRFARTVIPVQTLLRPTPGMLIEELDAELRHLWSLLKPRPLPKFRIRTRGPRRLAA